MCFLFIFGIYHLFIRPRTSGYDFLNCLAIIITVILVYCALEVLKTFIRWRCTARGLDKAWKPKILSLTVLGLSVLAGFVPRLVVFFGNRYLIWYSIYVSIGVINICRTTYESEMDKKYQFHANPKNRFSWMILYFHLAVLGFSIGMAQEFSINFWPIFVCQLWFAPIGVLASIEFVKIWRGSFVSEENVELDEVVVETDTNQECMICLQPYDTDRIPRVMMSCSHRVCESCMDHFLDTNQHLFCKICPEDQVLEDLVVVLDENADATE